MSGTIVDLLGNLTPELRYAVQFCPDCRRWGKPDEYLLCPVHAGVRLGAAGEPERPAMTGEEARRMKLYGPCEECGAARDVRVTEPYAGCSLAELFCPGCGMPADGWPADG